MASDPDRSAAGSNRTHFGPEAGLAVEPPPGAGSESADVAPDETADAHPGKEHHDHHLHLIDPDQDRWKWRAKIRRNPHQLFVYRIGVVLAGLALMALAIVTGPLPGPGGIPLFLLGLAVWASEFEWAHRVMLWFKKLLHRYLELSAGRKVLFWIIVATGCGLAWYGWMLIAGIPVWMPGPAERLLTQLPGVN